MPDAAATSAVPPVSPSEETFALLRLRLCPGLGPVRVERLLERFGSGRAAIDTALRIGPEALTPIDRLGAATARGIVAALPATEAAAMDEIEELARLGAHVVGRGDPAYPALLRSIPNAPPVLSVRGRLDPERDRFGVAIVGSRACTAYGVEQAERFSAALAQSGLTVVSGGARGIDTHAHTAALRAGGRTVVVLGCGLSHCYPPENKALFGRVLESGGAVISELPARSAPEARHFPARNRIISGMTLGVLVVEAGRKSGALITARVAADEQGREVLAIPGRVDSTASEGCLDLIKAGAAVAASPADVIEALEMPARHAHGDTHGDRYGGTLGHPEPAAEPRPRVPTLPASLSDVQRTICEALGEGRTLDDVARITRLPAEILRAEATMLELRRVVVRDGARLRVRRADNA